MLIPFEDLRRYNFSLSDVKVILQNPPYRTLNVDIRPCNGLIYLVSGSCRYSFEGGEFFAEPGAVIYLPLASRHTLHLPPEGAQFYRVDFTVTVNGEVALFSDHPVKITDTAPPECIEAILTLERNFGIGDNTIIKTQKICTVFAALQSAAMSADKKRLMPAVKYIQENATGEINCSDLAELCYLGISRFYELFGQQFGTTPLGYRDKLLVRRASALLSAGDVSVREVAYSVGFENAAYFSRFFKKHTGLSPSQFIGHH